jgi:hypothetical protein
MNLTFGICTAGGQDERVAEMIKVIRSEVSDPEIIVVGKCNVDALVVPFDESVKKGWITKKKNMIAQMAANPVIVYMHDYIRLLPGWRQSYDAFGYNWDLCTNKILKFDGSRAYDWFQVGYKACGKYQLVDYDLDHPEVNPSQYPSGNYFLAKREFMLTYPLDENLVWGQSEDMHWLWGLQRRRVIYKYTLNKNATVQYMKPQHHHHPNLNDILMAP